MAKAKRPPQTRKKLGGPRIGGDGPREAKAAAVADIQERMSGSTVLLTEYRGMTVGELAELRTALREADADYKVYKNTLASIAARNLGLADLEQYFQGPTAFAFTDGDPVVVAKKLTDFAKRVPTLVLKGGVLEGRVLSSSDVTALSTLDSREVMLAKIAGLFQSGLQNFVNLLATPLSQLGSVLAQLRDKLPDEGGAPSPDSQAAAETGGEPEASSEPATETPAADETPAEQPAEEPAAPAAEPAQQEQPPSDEGGTPDETAS